MFDPSKFAKETMLRLDCDVHFSATAQYFVEEEGKTVQKPGTFRCDVVDKATKQHYCFATGGTKSEALDAAMKVACSTPKPRTRAQEETDGIVQDSIKVSELTIAEQRKQIDDLKAQIAQNAQAVADKRSGGRTTAQVTA